MRERYNLYKYLRYIIPALTILLAGTASLFGFYLTIDDKLRILSSTILLIAVELIIERRYLHEKILDLIESKKRPIYNLDDKEIQFVEMIRSAKEEIWMSSLSLNAIATARGSLLEALIRGVKIQILAIDPSSNSIVEAFKYLPEFKTSDEFKKRIVGNLSLIIGLIANGQIVIKVIDRIPSIGYLIIDPNDINGMMTIRPYLYTNRNTDPAILLKKDADPYWYSIYMNDFEEAWNDSKIYVPSSEANMNIL